jgi:glycerol-3-phosphate dehydrogenase
MRRRMPALAERFGWSEMMVDHLLHRYGSLMDELLELIEEDPSLAEPLTKAPAYLRAEIAYACTHEGVLHMEDLMMRRTRLIYEVERKGMNALPEIAAIAAERLGWDSKREEEEITSYRKQAEAEEAAAQKPDDAAAAQARGHVGDPAPMQQIGSAAG